MDTEEEFPGWTGSKTTDGKYMVRKVGTKYIVIVMATGKPHWQHFLNKGQAALFVRSLYK